MVKLYKLNNDKITIFHLEVQTAREAGDRGFQMSLKRLYNRLEVALRVLSFSVALEIVWGGDFSRRVIVQTEIFS